jgi:hypothetical protein
MPSTESVDFLGNFSFVNLLSKLEKLVFWNFHVQFDLLLRLILVMPVVKVFNNLYLIVLYQHL